jgi:hypothetical protein
MKGRVSCPACLREGPPVLQGSWLPAAEGAPWNGEIEISRSQRETVNLFEMGCCGSPSRVEPRPFASVAKGFLFEYTGFN